MFVIDYCFSDQIWLKKSYIVIYFPAKKTKYKVSSAGCVMLLNLWTDRRAEQRWQSKDVPWIL